jgi:preprotein translocase subunit SecA
MFAPLRRKIRESRSHNASKKLLQDAAQVRGVATVLSELDDEALLGKARSLTDQDADATARLAVAVEAARRALGLSAYDVQIAGAMVLNRRAVAEMQTGEGKTLTAAIGAAAKALAGYKVHVATVNDYLAGRDADTMRPLFERIGLTVGHAGANTSPEHKRAAYQCDIVYATAQELAFDYLRDHLVGSRQECVQDGLEALIVDEADSILIDEAGTPLILSGTPETDGGLYQRLIPLVEQLTEGEHYHLDAKDKYVDVTDEGSDLIEAWLKAQGLLAQETDLHDSRGLFLVHAVNSSIAAHALYRRDIEYMVRDGEILIIDEHTGRALVGRRWADGLHQAVEAKEGLEVRAEAPTLASITYQGFMHLYHHLCGLTGTAQSEREEFREQYQLEVEVIPTHRPVQRVDDHDRVYLSDADRNAAIIAEVKEAHERGQPVLLGTSSVEASEALALALEEAGITAAILNARHHASEAAIIAEAGRPGAVTIATQMAGRGTDILLGGNLENALRRAPDPNRHEAMRERWEHDYAEVVAAGGLYVIGTTRAPSRRVDQQLRGRAGRQGDPGRSCFFLSLEDDFVKLYAGEKLAGLMERLEVQGDEALEGKMMDRIIRQAQQARELVDREARRELMKFDYVLGEQRAAVYARREQWLACLEGEAGEAERDVLVQRAIKAGVDEMVQKHVPAEPLAVRRWDSASLRADIARCWNVGLQEDFFKAFETKPEGVSDFLHGFAKAYYEHRKGVIRPEVLPMFEQISLLEGLDKAWQEQQRRLTMLRDGIHLRSFANENPRHAFQREAGELFGNLFEHGYGISANVLLGARIPARQADQQAA